MPDDESVPLNDPPRTPWNKGKLIGPKPPLRPKHVWSIRTRLMVEGRARDLAMFNLAIDSKLRGCGVMALRERSGARELFFVGHSTSSRCQHLGVIAKLVRCLAGCARSIQRVDDDASTSGNAHGFVTRHED